MSEDKRENGHNKKQKMKSAVQEEEEEYKPILQEIQVNPLVKAQIFLLSSTKYIEQGEEIPLSVAVQVNQNMPQSSNVAQGSKKVAIRKYKGIAIEEEVVLSKRKRPNVEIVEQLPKEAIADSENYLISMNMLISLMETCLEMNSEDAIEM